MISRTAASFWRRFQSLPADVREQAREAFRRFREDPANPGLAFKKLKGFPNYWSARITLNYRAVAVREGDTLVWFWIGNHAEFDRVFA